MYENVFLSTESAGLAHPVGNVHSIETAMNAQNNLFIVTEINNFPKILISKQLPDKFRQIIH